MPGWEGLKTTAFQKEDESEAEISPGSSCCITQAP